MAEVIGDKIEFKHLLSSKKFEGKIKGEYEKDYWVVDCGGKDKMVVVAKNEKTIKKLNEALDFKVDKLITQLLKEAEDLIHGGLSDNLTIVDVARKYQLDIKKLEGELEKGIKVEFEHTNNLQVAREIALDHLFEDPKYYEKLPTIEEKWL